MLWSHKSWELGGKFCRCIMFRCSRKSSFKVKGTHCIDSNWMEWHSPPPLRLIDGWKFLQCRLLWWMWRRSSVNGSRTSKPSTMIVKPNGILTLEVTRHKLFTSSPSLTLWKKIIMESYCSWCAIIMLCKCMWTVEVITFDGGL